MTSQEVPRLFEKAVILTASFGLPPTAKKVRRSQIGEAGNGTETAVTVKADVTAIKVSKVILDCPELKAISKKHAEIKAYIEAKALPSFFKGGMFWLSLDLIEEAEAKFDQFDTELQPLIEEFLAVYPQRAEEARTRLDELGDLADYLSIEEIREKFYFTRQYITFQSPENLPEVIRKQEADKMEQYFRDANVEIQAALRESMQELINHMLDKLSPSTDGKKKRFYDSSLDKVTGFLNCFAARNLTDDTALQALVDQARGIIGSTTPDDIRDSQRTQDKIRSGFEQIQAALDPLVSDRTRRIVLED